MAEEKQLVVKLALKAGGYQQEIKSINQDTKVLKSEFEKAKAGAENFESSLEGQKAKLKVVSGELQNTESKLKIYNTQLKKCEDVLEQSTKAFEEQEKEVSSLKAQIQDYSNAYGATSNVVKKLEGDLKNSEKALESKRKAVISADSSLKGMQITVNKTEGDISKLKSELSKTENELKSIKDGTDVATIGMNDFKSGSYKAADGVENINKKLDEAERQAVEFGAQMSMIGQGITSVGDKMTEVGKSIVSTMSDLSEKGMEYQASIEGTEFLLKGLEATTQELIARNSENATSIGMTEKQYTESAVRLANYQKTMGFTTEEIDKMNASTIQMVADLAAVEDVPFEEAMSSYQSMLKGNYEAGDKLNVSISANTLANTEYIKSLGKSWNELSETEKMTAVYLETQRQATSANGLAAQEAEASGMQHKLLNEELKEVTGTIGSALLPSLQPLIVLVRGIVNSVASWAKENPQLVTTIVTIIAVIGGLLAILGPIITTIGMLVISLGAMSTAFAAAGGIAAFFSASIIPIVATIGVVIGVIAALGMAIYSNWEGIKGATIHLIETCKPQFEALRNAFSNLWSVAQSIYTTIIQPLFKMIGQVIQYCIEFVTPILQRLIPVFTSVFNFISSFWNGIGRPVFSAIISIIQTLGSIVKPIFDTFRNVICGAMDAVLKPIQWVIDKLSSLLNWIGDAGSKVGGFLSKINPFRSVDINTVQQVKHFQVPQTAGMFRVMPMSLDSVALSGSYYQPQTIASKSIGGMIQSSNGFAKAINGFSGPDISNNSSNSFDMKSMEDMFRKMIDLLSLQNNLIEQNKPVFNIDGDELSNKLDAIGGRNMKLYGRFN